ncbi:MULTISPECIES: hypothetical protein [unclassified Streptomyces]|uniref:hypothetical protein n=1 Tax=unclassified Streptomyces TaxID=2593676 RepID=UPI002366CE3B|nr:MULTISPECIES: hypothetical protein [unclassified Streptomyces]MDF3140204.1 hypothetical protein [Streptomyces sp. T21Q-yed]WDF38221.1 hypothetical protein PBV52_16160 [Streptomyces sp. T12]
MKKAVFTTAALAIGAGLVGGSAAAASAAGGSGISTSPLAGLMSPTKVSPAVLPAADAVTRLAREGGVAKGSAFDKNKSGGMSGIYLDGMDPQAAKKPTIPVKNPAGSGEVQVHPLHAPTAAGLGTLLRNK